jgi:hypothetical protein
MSSETSNGEQGAIGVCKTCGMAIRVIFVNDEPERVLAPCGHAKLPTEESDLKDESAFGHFDMHGEYDNG